MIALIAVKRGYRRPLLTRKSEEYLAYVPLSEKGWRLSVS
jgi:hypothetical protein